MRNVLRCTHNRRYGQPALAAGLLVVAVILNNLLVFPLLEITPPAAPPSLAQYALPLVMVSFMPASVPGFGGTTFTGNIFAEISVLSVNVPDTVF